MAAAMMAPAAALEMMAFVKSSRRIEISRSLIMSLAMYVTLSCQDCGSGGSCSSALTSSSISIVSCGETPAGVSGTVSGTIVSTTGSGAASAGSDSSSTVVSSFSATELPLSGETVLTIGSGVAATGSTLTTFSISDSATTGAAAAGAAAATTGVETWGEGLSMGSREVLWASNVALISRTIRLLLQGSKINSDNRSKRILTPIRPNVTQVLFLRMVSLHICSSWYWARSRFSSWERASSKAFSAAVMASFASRTA